MGWILHLLVTITALKMSLSYNPPLPPFWEWGTQYDFYHNWEIRASAYRYPLISQRLQFAPLQDYDIQNNVRVVPDCDSFTRTEAPHDTRMNERSIPNNNVGRVQPEARINQHSIEEPTLRRSENGSSKILNLLKPSRRRGQADGSTIIFPGPTAATVKTRYEPEIPESCRNSTFCEDLPNYPQEEVDKLIARLGNAVRFQIDRLDQPDTPDINQRVGPLDENVELCQFEEKVVYPKGAQGADGKWYTLLNRKDNPVQGFRVEICNLSGGTSCAGIASFQQGYEARCKQKFVFRKVTAFESTDEGFKTFEKEVRVPSCCSCVARHTII